MNKYKLAIVMRTDLGMTKGKIAVQAGHASILAFVRGLVTGPHGDGEYTSLTEYRDWFDEGQFKIALKAVSEDQLLSIEEKAKAQGLPVAEVRDFGLTQVAPLTLTCIAIGPAKVEDVDKITGDLPLL